MHYLAKCWTVWIDIHNGKVIRFSILHSNARDIKNFLLWSVNGTLR